MAGISVQEAAERLDRSERTIRRWLSTGQLKGDRVDTPQGFQWRVYLDDSEGVAPTESEDPDAEHGPLIVNPAMTAGQDAITDVKALQELVRWLQEQMKIKDAQLGEALYTLRETQARMLPPPKEAVPWWRRIWKRNP